MTVLRRRDHLLDLVFLVGMALKGIDGFVELIVGVPLLFLPSGGLASIVHGLTAGELLEDPHDFIANILINGTHQLGAQGTFIIGLYLVIHGIVKLAIVISLILGATRIYPWAIGALGLLAVVQIVDFVIAPSVGVALLTLLDFVIIALTWREWHHHRSLKETLFETIAWMRSTKASHGSQGA